MSIPSVKGGAAPSIFRGGNDAPRRTLASADPVDAKQKSDNAPSENLTRTSAAWPEPWHKGVCPDKRSWANVKVQCNGCKALVKHQLYGSTCEGYCRSQGLQCLGAWEEVNDDCEVKSWHRCSEPIWGTSDAICECINPCAQTGQSCV